MNNKKLIRLTEANLHRIVRESVNKVIKEDSAQKHMETYNNALKGLKYLRGKPDAQILLQLIQDMSIRLNAVAELDANWKSEQMISLAQEINNTLPLFKEAVRLIMPRLDNRGTLEATDGIVYEPDDGYYPDMYDN